MDNLLLQAVAEAAGTQIAFSNGWRYGAPIAAGKISVNDLWNIVPPNPPVCVVELEGREMWEMMEENLERTLAADPYKQMGGYVKRFLGLQLYVKIENPPGARIQQFFVGDQELVRNRFYTAAFVTAQGVPKKYGRNRRELNHDTVDALRKYLHTHHPAKADLRECMVSV